MYSYTWDEETGGLLLNTTQLKLSKEPRPVYYKELDILGLDAKWKYEKKDEYPLMWAEANKYYYRGNLIFETHWGNSCGTPKIVIHDEPEPNCEALKFVDIYRMVEKNHAIMDSLVQETVKKVYNIYTKYMNKVDVFYVAFSGGKDSVVALDIVQRALPHNKFKVLFGDTGMEFPDTYDIISAIKKDCEEENIEFLIAKSSLDPEYTWKKFGPPSQTLRWCCSVHKTTPQILLLRNQLHNPYFRGMAFTGIRGDESASRSEYEDVSLGEKVKGQYSCHPILEWNSAELYNYIYERNLRINDAYKKGNSRAGCLVCPLASYKNMFFKEKSYGQSIDGNKSTEQFNRIILSTTSKELLTKEAVKEFMEIAGWKARRSGREILHAKTIFEDKMQNGILMIKLKSMSSNWREWIKTIGEVSFFDDNNIEIVYQDKVYKMQYKKQGNDHLFEVHIGTNTKTDIFFMASLKVVLRKSAYCIACGVCSANCPNGYITFIDNKVYIDNKCTKCKKCHDINYGCLLADSLRVPKGENKMGSVNRYGNMGIRYEWVEQYVDKQDDFWTSAHDLGSKKTENLKKFLEDCGVTEKHLFSKFGDVVKKIGIDNEISWGLIVSNAVYTSEYQWWIKNTIVGELYTPEMLTTMLGDAMSTNTKNHIKSAYRNIFSSTPQVGEMLGLGKCKYESITDAKSGKTKNEFKGILRWKWESPEPKVILYSLYKFAEACGGYYHFTLKRLMDHDVESDGVSPSEIFGLDEDTMKNVLNGLSINYPEYINVSFTLGLDNIDLRDNKTSKDVLELF